MSKLSLIAAAGTPALTDLFYGVQGGVEKKFTLGDLSMSGSVPVTLGDGTNNYTLSVDTVYVERVGKIVNVNGRILWTSIGAATSAGLALKGLPYASKSNTTSSGYALSFGVFRGIVFGSNVLVGELSQNSTTIDFFINKSDGSGSAVLPANAQNATGEIRFNLSYVAA